MDEPDATEEGGLYECALTELLAEGVDEDVRPLVNKLIDDPHLLEKTFRMLPPDQQERLSAQFLPEGDRGDGWLRNLGIAWTISAFKASLERVPTAAILRHSRNRGWTPAVGERCERLSGVCSCHRL